MSGQEPGDREFSNEEAARIVREGPALRAEPSGPDEEDTPGIDDDATTPDGAVSNSE